MKSFDVLLQTHIFNIYKPFIVVKFNMRLRRSYSYLLITTINHEYINTVHDSFFEVGIIRKYTDPCIGTHHTFYILLIKAYAYSFNSIVYNLISLLIYIANIWLHLSQNFLYRYLYHVISIHA